MKLLAILIIGFFSQSTFAENPEVLQYVIPVGQNDDYYQLRQSCRNNAYDRETRTMDKTNDTTVRVRMSDFRLHPAGLAYCYIKFFSTEKTTFFKNRRTFEMKRCRDKAKEIVQEPKVVWITYANRVRLPNGVKGCTVSTIEF